MLKVWITLCASALLSTCGKAQATVEFRGRLVEQVSQLLSDESGAKLEFNDDELSALKAEGAELYGDAEVLVMPPEAMAGRWLQIDGRSDWIRSDEDGAFRIADLGSEPATTQARIFREVLDAAPEMTVPLASLALGTNGMPMKPIRILLPLPGNMNGLSGPSGVLWVVDDLLGMALEPPGGCEAHCDAAAANPDGCCLDYDGPAGDGVARDTRQKKVCNGAATSLTDKIVQIGQCQWCKDKVRTSFKNSTCYKWTRSDRDSACRNERAYCGIEPLKELNLNYNFDEDAPELGVGLTEELKKCLANNDCRARYDVLLAKCEMARESCYHNHKYRNCQQLSLDDFSVSPASATVAPGAKVTFHVRNNTVANRTVFDNFGSADVGEITGARSTKGPTDLKVTKVGTMRVIDHYSDALKKHFEDVDVMYTAPKKMPSKSKDEKLCGDKPGTLYFLAAPGMGAAESAVNTAPRVSRGKQIKVMISAVGAKRAGLALGDSSVSEDDPSEASSCSVCKLLDRAELQAVTGLAFSEGTADPVLPSDLASGCAYDVQSAIPCYAGCCVEDTGSCPATAGIHLSLGSSGALTPDVAKGSRPAEWTAVAIPDLGDEAFYFDHFGFDGPPGRVDVWAFEGSLAANCFYSSFFDKTTDTLVLECAELIRKVFAHANE